MLSKCGDGTVDRVLDDGQLEGQLPARLHPFRFGRCLFKVLHCVVDPGHDFGRIGVFVRDRVQNMARVSSSRQAPGIDETTVDTEQIV